MIMRRIVLFLGPPGAGKGSLSSLCVRRLGWHQLSTGNLCREHIARGTTIGQEIDFAIKSGKLISDSLVLGMVDDWFTSEVAAQTIIFDGFPRTVAQAESLQRFAQERGNISLELVHLTIPDEELMYRLLARSICQNGRCQKVYSSHKTSALMPEVSNVCNECGSTLMRRADDEAVAIEQRLKIYHEHEQGLLKFYEESGHTINSIEATSPLEEVYMTLLNTVGNVSQ